MNVTFNRLIEKIHWGTNPYDNYTLTGTDHFKGWGSEHPLFEVCIQRLRPRLRPQLIIEVGSFLGGSAIHMADLLKQYEVKDAAILCVDTWLAEQVLWSIPEQRKKLNIIHGKPTFYRTFLNNVVDRHHEDTIVPLPMPSLSASRYIRQSGLTAQFIYIDGCHEEGDCYRDLEAYWKLLDSGGAMLIDDYKHEANGMFDGLIRDVERFSIEKQLAFEVSQEKALFLKP